MDRHVPESKVTLAAGVLGPQVRTPILVADDEDAVRKVCARILSAVGYTVEQAADGAEVLAMLERAEYCLLLLDVRMPVLDGIACLHRLRHLGHTLPVLMVTGANDVDTAVAAMRAGATDFIGKPFQVAQLLTRIERLLAPAEPGPAAVTEVPPAAAPPSERRIGGDRRIALDRRQDADRRTGDRRGKPIDPVVAYIEEHATEIRSRQQVAEILGLTVEEVSARVREVTGQFFRRFLLACRVSRARGLLEATDLSIAEIADRTGFATVQHFSRIFAGQVGISPRAYRQQHRADRTLQP
ncbi:MAG: response regulator [Candidatus Latescibacterota bacterium]|jgi:YesN/AraC family two-component response regulator